MRRKFVVVFCVLTMSLPSTKSYSQPGEIREIDFYQYALEARDIETWRGFIGQFPESEMMPEAEAELALLLAERERLALEERIFDTIGAVTFQEPLKFGPEGVMGNTIAQIIQSKPLYAPIEGLPREVWANEQCSSCHVWTRENLCEHGQRYIAADPSSYQEKSHPFGGPFKMSVRNWTINGCQ